MLLSKRCKVTGAMELRKDIVSVLEQCKSEIQANMAAKGINASGRTSRGFQVLADGGSIALVLSHEEKGLAPMTPRYIGYVQTGVAPLRTLEIGRPSGRVPKGFYYIIKQWTRDKGLSFSRESERQTFAYFLARKIAREGTRRHTANVQVYDVPVKKAKSIIMSDIRAAVAGAMMTAAESNFK